MSRHLPARANLDHLKKQAKALLGDLERQNPDAKLADALHAVAREYGFATWPKLKEYVESLPREPAPAVVQQHPFVGRWTADVSSSRQHPANPYRNATLEIVVSGDAVTFTNVVVDTSGHEERGTHTILVDGSAHPPGDTGRALIARWLGSHVLEAVEAKDGQVVGRGTYEVSADGATMTISSAEQVVVLERERSGA